MVFFLENDFGNKRYEDERACENFSFLHLSELELRTFDNVLYVLFYVIFFVLLKPLTFLWLIITPIFIDNTKLMTH